MTYKTPPRRFIPCSPPVVTYRDVLTGEWVEQPHSGPPQTLSPHHDPEGFREYQLKMGVPQRSVQDRLCTCGHVRRLHTPTVYNLAYREQGRFRGECVFQTPVFGADGLLDDLTPCRCTWFQEAVNQARFQTLQHDDGSGRYW